MGNITAANAVLSLVIASLYPGAVQIQGFATDDAFDFPDVEGMETMLGVDGVLSAGVIPVVFNQDIVLQADSPSNEVFENWFATQQQLKSPLQATGTVILPAIGMQYQLSKGFLISGKPVAGVKKVLQPRKWGIRWNTLQASAYAGL
jgi:hypothetical protein